MSKPSSTKSNAGTEYAGAQAVLAGGRVSANQNSHNQSSTDKTVLADKSTTTAVQLAKVLVLLRQGPKTTLELRKHGILMPAARVHTLKHQYLFGIQTELVALYDAEGIPHRNCARYHLTHDAAKLELR